VVGEGVEFSQAECSLHSGKYSLSLFCHSDILLWPRIIQQSNVTHTHQLFQVSLLSPSANFLPLAVAIGAGTSVNTLTSSTKTVLRRISKSF